MEEVETEDGIKMLAQKIDQTLTEGLGREPTRSEIAAFIFGWKMKEAFTKIIEQNKGEQSK